jgi:hypothetical protein
VTWYVWPPLAADSPGLPLFSTGNRISMQDDKIIDVGILKDKFLLQKISDQKDLFIRLLSDLANRFPLDSLALIHPNSKGSSISKGNQLDNCPYQVLDLVRDFDLESGFNIRILNWWGHGLMVLILYGSQTAIKFELPIEKLKRNYSLSKTKSPWDYQEILESESASRKLDLKDHLLEFGHVQLFRTFPISESFGETLDTLEKEICLILDYHHQSFPSEGNLS